MDVYQYALITQFVPAKDFTRKRGKWNKFKQIGVPNVYLRAAEKNSRILQDSPEWHRYSTQGLKFWAHKLWVMILLWLFYRMVLGILNKAYGQLLTINLQFEDVILFKFKRNFQKKKSGLMGNPNLSLYYIYTENYNDKSAISALNQAYKNRKL